MIFKATQLLAVLAIVIATAPAVHAQSTNVPAGIVPADTLVLASLDLSEIDPQALIEFAGLNNQAGGQNAAAMVQATATAWLETLGGAGAERLFIVVPGSAVLYGGVCMIVPCDEPAKVLPIFEGATKMVQPPLSFKAFAEDGRVIFCPEAVSEVFSQPEAKELREDLERGLTALKGMPHKLIISIPDALQEELVATWPDSLGAEMGVDFSPKAFAKNVRTLGIQWRLPPEPAVQGVLYSPSEAAAERAATQLRGLVGKLPGSLQEIELAVQGDRVEVDIPVDVITEFVNVQRAASKRMQSANDLKQLALAMHNYEHANGALFPTAIRNEAGEPLLSWRVKILPFLGQQELHDQFHLDEPWDSEHNRQLIAMMPPVFDTFLAGAPQPGMTKVRLPMYPGSMWSGDEPLRFRDIRDGLSNTMAIIDAPESAAVVWTKPQPWEIGEAEVVATLFGDRQQLQAAWGDGSVRTLAKTIDPEVLRSLLTTAGGEPIDNYEFAR